MSPKLHRRLFSVWYGIVLPPLFVGALVLGFVAHWAIGAALLLCTAVWFYDMGETTCSRCGSYGTLNCGVQGKVVSWIWKRRDPRAVSRFRVRLHLAGDALLIALLARRRVPVVGLAMGRAGSRLDRRSDLAGLRSEAPPRVVASPQATGEERAPGID